MLILGVQNVRVINDTIKTAGSNSTWWTTLGGVVLGAVLAFAGNLLNTYFSDQRQSKRERISDKRQNVRILNDLFPIFVKQAVTISNSLKADQDRESIQNNINISKANTKTIMGDDLKQLQQRSIAIKEKVYKDFNERNPPKNHTDDLAELYVTQTKIRSVLDNDINNEDIKRLSESMNTIVNYLQLGIGIDVEKFNGYMQAFLNAKDVYMNQENKIIGL